LAFLIRRHQKWARRLGPSGLAMRLFRRLCTKTQPKCGLGPAGLAFRALQMHQAPIFRPFDVRLAVSDMLRSTPTTPSVYKYKERPYILKGGKLVQKTAKTCVVVAGGNMHSARDYTKA